jgi:hypothetical protein
LSHLHAQGILFLGNPSIYIPLVRLQEEVHFYEAPENETRQLENWINYKMTVVNVKMDSFFMTVSPYAETAKWMLGQ